MTNYLLRWLAWLLAFTAAVMLIILIESAFAQTWAGYVLLVLGFGAMLLTIYAEENRDDDQS